MFGMVSGSRVFSQPSELYRLYSGICVTTAGSIIVESMKPNKTFLPQNLHRAKPKAINVADSGTAMRLKIITNIVLPNASI